MIISPNDWMRRAGAHVTDGKLILPYKFILTPMTIASEAVVEYKKNQTLNLRLKNVLVIALCIRIVDKSVLRMLAKVLNGNDRRGVKICSECIGNGMFEVNLTKLRKDVNKKIIHILENAGMVDPKNFQLALNYYDEIFKLPLTPPFIFEGKKGIPFCERCLKKNKQLRFPKKKII